MMSGDSDSRRLKTPSSYQNSARFHFYHEAPFLYRRDVEFHSSNDNDGDDDRSDYDSENSASSLSELLTSASATATATDTDKDEEDDSASDSDKLVQAPLSSSSSSSVSSSSSSSSSSSPSSSSSSFSSPRTCVDRLFSSFGQDEDVISTTSIITSKQRRCIFVLILFNGLLLCIVFSLTFLLMYGYGYQMNGANSSSQNDVTAFVEKKDINFIHTPNTHILFDDTFPCSPKNNPNIGDRYHPLDALSDKEQLSAIQILNKGGYTNNKTFYVYMGLDEPNKADVWKYMDQYENKKNQQRQDKNQDHQQVVDMEKLERRAFVIVRINTVTAEAVVSLTKGEVVSFSKIPHVQPALSPIEYDVLQRLTLSDESVLAELKRREIDIEWVVCEGMGVGSYEGTPYHNVTDTRYAHCVCYINEPSVYNYWTRPIESFRTTINLDTQELIEFVYDKNVPPITHPQHADIQVERVGRVRHNTHIGFAQPEGFTFTVDGSHVEWGPWSFHVRPDMRTSVNVQTVTFRDGNTRRKILYQASLVDIFVPYMDPSPYWYFRNFMDVGEYAMGRFMDSLRAADCGHSAYFFNFTMINEFGSLYTVPNAMCVFERYSGSTILTHVDAFSPINERRQDVSLIVRQIVTLGNYEYIIDVEFKQDASIKFYATAAGMDEMKMVHSVDVNSDTYTEDSMYGSLIAPNLVGVYHDHYLSFRIDFDLDGIRNSFAKDHITPVSYSPQLSPRKSGWILKREIALDENDGKCNMSMKTPTQWTFINMNERGPLGHHPGYVLRPNSNALTQLSPDDSPQIRGGFTANQLWVTPYAYNEKYSAGMYPNQNPIADGLPLYTSNNRNIENEDLVAWYTLGFHHVARTEDYPAMPNRPFFFELVPFNFYERNPAVELDQ